MLSLVNTTTNIASDISDIKNDRKKTEIKIAEQQNLTNQIRNTSIDYENRSTNLNQIRVFRENYVLRKTSVPRKTSMSGLVCFIRKGKPMVYVFEYKIGDEVFRFKYQQELIKP